MSDDEIDPAAAAAQRQVETEQMEAGLRGVAATVVTIRRTLVEGGFPEDAATRMAENAWAMFFPGRPSPLGFLFGGPPS